MKNINKLLLGMIFLMAILPMVSAQESFGTFKQNECVNLIQTCSNCTYINITNIAYPNSSIALSNVEMTADGTLFNYSFCNTSIIGTYFVNGIGDLDGINSVWNYVFDITYTGDALTAQQSYIYIGGLIFLVLLILGISILINKLPSNDSVDEEGSILQINQLKHLREVLWIVIWGLGLAIMFIISNLSLAYLSSPMMGNLFFVIWQMMFYVTIIGVPIYIIWIIYKLFRDAEMKRMLERGIDMRGTP